MAEYRYQVSVFFFKVLGTRGGCRYQPPILSHREVLLSIVLRQFDTSVNLHLLQKDVLNGFLYLSARSIDTQYR